MVSDEHDPDVVKWGLELFESDPYLNCGFQGDSFDRLTFEGDGRDGSRNFNNVNYVDDDEDEVIAYALALSQLRVEDGVEMPEQCDEYVEEGEVGALPQDWVGGLLRNYSSDQEDCEEVTGSVEPSSSCTTSPGEEAYQDAYSLELMDGSVFDSEATKWLNELIPIPHIPRINGEIPSVDEATLDHQRLLDRLQVYDLVEHKVQGDGNCQFRALSHQFYRTPEHHIFVRQQVVNQLKSNPENYGGYVPMAYDDYLEKMSKNGEWGDHVTLQAAADSYGVKIIVITSFKDTCYIEILPNVQRSNRVILLSFWAEVHYNSISPQGDVPAFEPTKKKKSRRRLRNKHLGSSNENINELRTLTS